MTLEIVLTEIAVAVVEHAGCYLIGLRPPGVPLAGLWEFPGGKTQPGGNARRRSAARVPRGNRARGRGVWRLSDGGARLSSWSPAITFLGLPTGAA